MKRRKCGNSNLELPILGTGCWSFGGGSYWGDQDQKDVDAVVNMALDIGCNYFDTAEAYNDGASEESLGKALKDRRSQALIGTKVSPSNTSPDALREHCEASLRRLQTDTIDLYMIHWPIHLHSIRHFTKDESIINNPPSAVKAYETLTRLQEEGKIQHIGVSNFGVKQLTEALDTGAKIVINELPYNFLMRAIEVEIMPFCYEKGIGVVSYMPLMQGLLSGKYKSADEVPPMRVRTRHFSSQRPGSRHGEAGEEELTFETIKQIRNIADGQNISMTHLAIAWCMVNPAVNCVLSGVRNTAQLENNVQASDLSLSSDLIERLNDVTSPLLGRLGANPDYYENRKMGRSW